MMKHALSATAFALTMTIGAPSLSADERQGGSHRGYLHRGYLHRGYSHHGYGQHYGHYQPRPSYSQPRYSHPHYSWRDAHLHGYDHGCGRAIYNPGFNRGAEAQWRLSHRRWAYDYAAWQQRRGPTGIFALAGGLAGGGGYSGGGYGGGAGYGSTSQYGSQCNCE